MDGDLKVNGSVRGCFLGVHSNPVSAEADAELIHSVSFRIGPRAVGQLRVGPETAKILHTRAEGLIGRWFKIHGLAICRRSTKAVKDDITGTVTQQPLFGKNGDSLYRLSTAEGALYSEARPKPARLELLPVEQSAASEVQLVLGDAPAAATETPAAATPAGEGF